MLASGHPHPPRHDHSQPHSHATHHTHPQPLEARIVTVEQDLLARNDARAAANRSHFEAHGIFVVNLVSSPGSGKTALLVRIAGALRERTPISVIEGDQQTSNDVERIRAAGIPGIQVNTGKGCHLDAHMVARAVESLAPEAGGVLFIENVGNLVCPAAFDLGEAHKVVIISTTEGEDKPLKYPDMFAASDLMLVNKVDLLPHLEFDVGRCIEYARRVNPEIQVLLVSATTGEGIGSWLEWILAGRERVAGPSPRWKGGAA
jgi:hydrogenase nickel incorporation protein HypB